METYTVKHAQDCLKELLSDAHKGKTVVIAAEKRAGGNARSDSDRG